MYQVYSGMVYVLERKARVDAFAEARKIAREQGSARVVDTEARGRQPVEWVFGSDGTVKRMVFRHEDSR